MRRLTIAAAGVVLACAQYGAPPGGERDRLAPQVIETAPAPYSVVPELRGPVVIRFDERLSEEGADEAILVSPRTGDVNIERDGSTLRISIDGGWRQGQIYRIVILPVLQDLFGNRRAEPGELVFSTGPDIPNTALAGIVTDRITGQPPERALVHAVRRVDSTVYLTPSSPDGFYALLNLPTGTYDLTGFVDANQNLELDETEPRAPTQAVTLLIDTLTIDLAVLRPDTTPARLQSAAQDGIAVRVQFDDHVDSTGIASATARLYSLPDTLALNTVLELLTPSQHAARMPRDAAPAPEPGDTLAAPADTLLPRGDTMPQQPDPPALPTRDIVVVPADTLAPGDYLIEVQGVVNINGVAGGGGRAPFTLTPLPPPDTTSAMPDTTGVVPDTARVPPPRLR